MRALIVALTASLGMVPDLALLPPAVCVETADVRQCEVARPNPWTDAERTTIASALARLSELEVFRGILDRVAANGFRGLQRYASDTQRTRAGEITTKFGPGFVLYASKSIGITDAFFELADLRDPRGGYRVGDLVLLHELIHAFDDRSRSTAREFTSLTGWAFANGRWEYRNRVSISGYNGVFADTLTLYARGRYLEAWTRDRAFATSLTDALPRLQSFASPAESFADVLAHLMLDPTAREYLSPPLVDWFERRVFPELRGYAPPPSRPAQSVKSADSPSSVNHRMHPTCRRSVCAVLMKVSMRLRLHDGFGEPS
jgi:hypothetical protein